MGLTLLGSHFHIQQLLDLGNDFSLGHMLVSEAPYLKPPTVLHTKVECH